MKSSDEIERRLRVRLGEELTKRLKHAGARVPVHCVHNRRHSLDSRKTREGEANSLYNSIETASGQTIGLCMLGAEDPETWPGDICEDDIDAQRCPYFTPLKDKDMVIDEFKQQITDVTWLEQELPDVASLVWVLDKPAKLSFLDRLKALFFRVKLEPVVKGGRLAKLLPPSAHETIDS